MYFTGFLLVDGTDHPSDAGARRFSTGASNVARRRSWYRYRAMAAVNLHSDTQTLPSDGMRRAIASAEVADEQRKRDPTVNALQERVADLLGHEAALFLPSGSMCNQIAIRLHTRPGDEMIIERHSHPIIAESGGPAAHSGVMIHALDGEGGMYTGAQVRAAVRTPGNRYEPRSRLVCVEQSTNYGGGRVW